MVTGSENSRPPGGADPGSAGWAWASRSAPALADLGAMRSDRGGGTRARCRGDGLAGPLAEIFDAVPRQIRWSAPSRKKTVGRLIRAGRSTYDAHPAGCRQWSRGTELRKANDSLYNSMEGLGAARTALRMGGALAVWSSGPNANFTRRLRRAGFGVEEIGVRANGARIGGARHVIWIATSAAPRAHRRKGGADRGARA